MLRRLLLMVVLSGAATWAGAGELRLAVEEPTGVARQQWPVTSGVPLKQGDLRDEQQTALCDPTGAAIPLQTETLARWPDGSVRWLLLDFQIDLASREKKNLTLKFGPDVRREAIPRAVQVLKLAEGKVALATGVLRAEYDPKVFQPHGAAWLTPKPDDPQADQRLTINCSAVGAVVTDEQKNWFSSQNSRLRPAEITVEQSGPIRACLRVTGWHRNEQAQLFRYVARIHAWRGQPYVRIHYTFINDHQEALLAKIRKLELRFWNAGASGGCLLDGKPTVKGRVLQVDENQYLLDGQPAGRRACGWVAVGSEKSGFAVGLREFWQNWPKAFNCRPGFVGLELCPDLPSGLYDGKPLEEESKLYYALRGGVHSFKIGTARTHEIWVNYFSGKPDAQRLGTFFQAAEDPLLAVSEPTYASATKVLGEFPPADPAKYFQYDAWLSRALDAHLQRREQDREFGMLNYGDWYGERQVNWGNLEYDLAHGLFLQYLRTGDRRFFLRAEQAARHHVDVDVVHATNPFLKNPWGPPPQVGEIWLHCLNHTGGYYENAALPVERTYQMGHSTNFGHVWVGGDFEYYYLTGDRRAREVAIEIADAMVRHCPTAYGDHIRGLGWPLVLVLNAYDATGDKKYLDAATACWQVLKKNLDGQRGWVVRLAKGHCLHPAQTCYGNVPFMEGLTLCALTRYHRITQDPEVLRALSVGIDQMIRECWQEDKKVLRYTPCPLSSDAAMAIFLSAEAWAYEVAATGNAEHKRILREGFRAALPKGHGGDIGKSLGQIIHFAPHALSALADE